MQTLSNSIPIPELIAKTDALMVSLDYKPTVMRHFRQAWNALKNHAIRRGETYLTAEFGYALLREHYHIEPFERNLSSFKSVTRRAVMLLLEYQVSGGIAKRTLMRDHSFPEGFFEAGSRYIGYLSNELHLSEGTIHNHRKTLEYAFDFFDASGAHVIGDVTITHINQYLKTYAGCAKSYILGQINSLKRFFAYTYQEGYTATSFSFPEVSVCKDRKVPEYYTADEIKRLLDAVDRANPRGKRDYAMLLLGARYGLRICDIKALELRNIDFINNAIGITQIKTDKPLTLDLLPDVGWAIIDYVKNGRPKSDASQIFIRHVPPYTTFIRTDNVAHIIGRYANAAGITQQATKKSSFHMLRYGLANELLQKDISLTAISGILGHSELNVTTRYTKIDVPQLSTCALEVPK
jgi:site-specific recombinase XerD